MGNRIFKDKNQNLYDQESIRNASLDLQKYVRKMMDLKQELEINQIIYLNKQIQQLSEINEAQIEGSAGLVEEYQIKINIIAQNLRRRGYDTVKFIAKGGFGIIFLSKHSNGLRYVIKAQRPFSKDPIQHQQFQDELATEIEALSNFNSCKNVVQYLGHELDEESNYSFIKLQECKGTLEDILNLKQQFNEQSFIKYANDIIQGIEQIHSKKFVIQDLKPENIFIDLNDKALIGDLGLSKKLKEGRSYLSIAQGNYCYFAPEQLPMYIGDMLQFGISNNNSHLSSDIYSFGLILYRLLCKSDLEIFQRFQTKCQVDPQNLIDQFKFKNEIREIIMKCTSFNPYERPTASEVQQLLKELFNQTFSREFDDVSLPITFQKYSTYFQINELIQNSQNTIIPVINESSIQEQNKIQKQLLNDINGMKIQIVLSGIHLVGKTRHLNSITKSKHDLYETQETQLGILFEAIRFQVDELTITLQIWDTMGYDKMVSLIQTYNRQSKGFLYYVTDNMYEIKNSIEYIKNRMKELKEQNVLKERNCQIILLKKEQNATQEQKLEISQQLKQLLEWTCQQNIIVDDPIEVYIPTGQNTHLPFENIIRNILKYQYGYLPYKVKKYEYKQNKQLQL